MGRASSLGDDEANEEMLLLAEEEKSKGEGGGGVHMESPFYCCLKEKSRAHLSLHRIFALFFSTSDNGQKKDQRGVRATFQVLTYVYR
jgi:hypothetical protein